MLRTLKDLAGYKIESTDGLIGRIAGAYFDDHAWTVRYLVVNTGSWLDAREVLISPTSLGRTDALTRRVPARLSTQQVKDSPSIDLDRPVSRQQETQVAAHYGWPTYWTTGLWESRIPATMAAVRANASGPEGPHDAGDPHLRSSREVSGYHLHALDDTLGHVEDFVIDDESWTIRYIAVDTSNWWFGGHVLISPKWIQGVRWAQRTVDLAVTRDVIKHSPTWNPEDPITRDYEDRLGEYYKRREAWSADPRASHAPVEPRSLG